MRIVNPELSIKNKKNRLNIRIKSLFDLCAKSAIQCNPEMKIYYNKRVDEGKNKMSIITFLIK